MRTIDDEERRARLGRRHALAAEHRADDVVGAARAVVALHGTDPATTVLSAVARTRDAVPADVDRALHDDRSLVRVLAMRRTVFAVPLDLGAACLAGASDVVARQLRRQLLTLLAASGVEGDLEAWIRRAEQRAIEVVRETGPTTGAAVGKADPRLGTRLQIGKDAYAATVSVASRVLTLLSAEGHVVRARPAGGWASTQTRWQAMDSWCDLGPRPSADDAASEIARRWLHAYGPATLDDLQWWTGWTKTRTKAAIASLDTVEVGLGGGTGVVLRGDEAPVEPPAPWVALLPALDPSIMSWKDRGFLLGPHREQLFDVNGNAGPTVWVDGRVVGGWVQREGGEVVTELLQDVGSEAADLVAQHAAALTTTLGDVRLTVRARGWTPLEKRLRA